MTSLHKHFFFLTFFVSLFSIALFTSFVFINSLNLNQTYAVWIVGLSLFSVVFFVFASVLYRYFDSFFTRFLYLISSYLGGIFLYWFFASVALSFIFVLSFIFKISYIFEISILLYTVAFLFAIIGFFQSKKIKIVRYFVKKPDQYPELAQKKFALIADTHFGPVNQERFARRLFKKIINQNPDAVLFPGDMFDSECYKDVEKIKKEILNLTSKVPVFFSPGNHEQYGAYHHYIQIATDGGMTVLSDEGVRFLGIPIFGLNFKQTKNMDEIEKLIKSSISPERPAIVLNHEPVFHQLLSDAGTFLVVSGHTHNGQFWPGKYPTKLFYGKYTYGMEIFNEMVSITTNGAGTFGPPMRTFNSPEIVMIEFY